MTHSFRIYLSLSALMLLLVVSGYQLSVALMHDLLEDELRSWQQREVISTSYATWKKKESLISILISLSPYNGLALENSARFYVLGAELAETSPASTGLAFEHRQQAFAAYSSIVD